MKRDVEPDPFMGQKGHASTCANGEQGKKETFGTPAKPRANTVATFLCPQLPPRHPGNTDRARASISGHASVPRARVQDRRNAYVGNPLGLVTAGTNDLRGGHRVLDGETLESSSSMNKREARTPRQHESSLSAIRHTGGVSRHLTSSGIYVETTSQQACGVAKDATAASLTRGPATTGGTRLAYVPPFESFSAEDSSQLAARESREGKDSDYALRTARTATTTVGQSCSFQELDASRRDRSAHCRYQLNTGNDSGGKAKEVGGMKVGFTLQSERERLVPTSYLLSATRTRESLLVPGEGRAYHLGVQHGELHNRILTVGHAGRADWLAERFLDPQMRTLSLKSNRNFRLHSGYYKRKAVSIVAVGMGSPMMDVLVREASYITEGPLAVVRLGTCTLLDQELRPGSIVVASPGSLGCYTNYAYFDGTAVEYSRTQGCLWDEVLRCSTELKPYTITRPCAADPELSRLIYRHAAALAPDSVFEGLNASAETFYSCQAREDQLFRDENEDLLETLLRCGAQTMEMETHQLLHLASRRIELMKAAAVHIGVTSRTNDHFMHPITPSQLNDLVAIAGRACLDALVDVPI